MKEHVVQGPAFLRQHPLGHLDPLGPKLGQALAGHQGVGVPGAHHHPGDAGLQNGLGAGGLLSLVAAGLQGDVEGGAGGVLPAGGQRRPLGVEVSPPGVVPLADDPPLLHQHRPHHGVGAGPAGPLSGQVQSQGHIVLICHLDHLRARKKRSEANLQSAQNQHSDLLSLSIKKLWNEASSQSNPRQTDAEIPRMSSIFFHPDYTVGFGITPNPAAARLADYTADREFHPALKIAISLSV